MNRNSINVGKKIKTYRKAKKYTLKNLAEKTRSVNRVPLAAGKGHDHHCHRLAV